MATIEKDYVGVREASKMLGVSRPTIQLYIMAGRLKAERIGPIWAIRRADLKALVRPAKGRPPKPNKPGEG